MQKTATWIKRLSPDCKSNHLIQNGSYKVILMLGTQVGTYCESVQLNSWHLGVSLLCHGRHGRCLTVAQGFPGGWYYM